MEKPTAIDVSIGLANQLKSCLSSTHTILHSKITTIIEKLKVQDTTFLIANTFVPFIY